MLRKLVCSTGRSSAALTVTLVGSYRWLSTEHTGERWVTITAPHQTQRAALLVARRSASTASTQEGSASNAELDAAAIIDAADWKSPRFEERLGFRAADNITEERLKRHYYVLAKHFHPDVSAAAAGSGSATSGEAFRNVKEAYEAISANLKAGGSGRGGSSEGSADFAGGFTYSDEARRRAQMRLLGDTVVLFVAMTVLLIFVVSRHNKSRMKSRYLWHLVWIFFMIQLFPRLLAAAIIFAAHSMYLLDNVTLQERAAISLVVERRPTECTVKLDGIRADAAPNVVVQVTATVPAAESVSSTLTFDKGVTEFLLPLPATAESVYHITAVDEARKLVLVDRTISAML